MDSAFDTLTPKERKTLGLDKDAEASPVEAIRRQANRLTKGADQKKLERDLRRLERAEWE